LQICNKLIEKPLVKLVQMMYIRHS